jgi:CYTH domain-containing protein
VQRSIWCGPIELLGVLHRNYLLKIGKLECPAKCGATGCGQLCAAAGASTFTKKQAATRSEYEYEIPFGEGNAMLETLAEKPLIEKTRYKIPVGNLTWEIDEFLGENAGLIVAEVELQSEDQTFDKPLWVGDEVTNDPRYFNANLVKNPFTRW